MKLTSDKLLNAVNGLNFLSSLNTYAEAMAGSVMFGASGKANLALSAAVARMDNTINASMGKNALVKLSGDMTVNASNGNNARVLAGSLSAGTSKASVGAAVAVIVDEDEVTTTTGEGLNASAEGSVSQRAATTGSMQSITAQMAAAMNKDGSASAGGAVNVIITKNETESTVGDKSTLKAGRDVDIASNTAFDLMAIAGSANVAGSTTSAVAAGGSVNVIVDSSQANTKLGKDGIIQALEDVNITSDVRNEFKSAVASLSAAASMNGTGAAGVVNVIVSKSKANVDVQGYAKIRAEEGDLTLRADNDAWMLNAALALTGAGDTALGLSAGVNVFNREAKVNVAESALWAGNNLYVQSKGRDTNILAGLTASGAKGLSMGGTVGVLVQESAINTRFEGKPDIAARRNAILKSDYGDFTLLAAGNIAGSLSKTALGAAAVVAVKKNDIRTDLANANVIAYNDNAADTAPTLNGAQKAGIYVGANAKETEYIGAAGVALSAASSAINGAVTVLVNENRVIADAQNAALTSYAAKSGYATVYKKENKTVKGQPVYTPIADPTTLKSFDNIYQLDENDKLVKVNRLEDVRRVLVEDDNNGASAEVQASDDTKLVLLAGGVNASTGLGAGAAVVTNVSGKEVSALSGEISAYGDVTVSADNKDDLITVAVNAGVSGGTAVQLGAAVQVLKSKAIANASGDVTAKGGSYRLTANNQTDITAAAVEVGAGSNAITPVGLVTIFKGETDARQQKGTKVAAKNDVNISATADKNIKMLSIGAAAGSIGISGTVNLIISKDKTQAVAETGTQIKSIAGGLNIESRANYKLRGLSGAVGAGQTAVAVNAVVSVLKTQTLSELGGRAETAKSVSVKADGARDIIDAVATVGAGQIAAGVGAAVVVAGTKMSQDAADMIAYGNADSKDQKATFDPDQFLESLNKANGGYAKNYQQDVTKAEISGAVEGNGRRETSLQVGTASGEGKDRKFSFDAATGYRSSDFDSLSFKGGESDTGRGERFGLDEKDQHTNKDLDTQDVKNAKNLNTYTYEGDPEDAIIARITKDATVSSGDRVNVSAAQPVTADLIGATVGAGAISVGVSAAVAVLRSNVSASSLGTIQRADGGVSVTATSKAGEIATDEDSKKRDETIVDLMSNKTPRESADKITEDDKKDKEANKKEILEKIKPSNRAIRVFGVAAGVGAIGVAVSASVVLTDNQTQAILGGTVKAKKDVNVSARQDYGTVLAATGVAAVGAIGAGTTAAAAQSNGTVRAQVERDAKIETDNHDVNITTEANVGVDTAAATVGAGGIAVNAGLGLAFNRVKQSTGIGAGAQLQKLSNLNVKGASNTNANSYLLGVSAGGVGVNLNAAVTDVKADVNTYLGEAGAAKAVTVEATGDVNVSNDSNFTSTPRALSVAVGGVAVGGNVLLAFNQSTAKAAIVNSNIKANNLKVKGDLAGSATASLSNLEVGGVAVGISVSLADIHAENRAALEDSMLDLSGDLSVVTGEGEHHATSATAESMVGNIGLVSVGLNTANARNNTKNYATLSDNKRVNTGGNLTVNARADSDTGAKMKSLDVGLVNVGAAAVVSMNDAEARSFVQMPEGSSDKPLMTVGKIATFDATQNAHTTAEATIGGGALIAAKLNVALAYGRTKAVVQADLSRGVKLSGLRSNVSGSNDVNTKVTNSAVLAGIKASAGSLLKRPVFLYGDRPQRQFHHRHRGRNGQYTIRHEDHRQRDALRRRQRRAVGSGRQRGGGKEHRPGAGRVRKREGRHHH